MIKLVDSLFGFINVRLHVMTQGCENKKNKVAASSGVNQFLFHCSRDV